MTTVAGKRATLDDLYREEGKAELIDGRIVRFMASGLRPGRLAFKIARNLDDYVEAEGRGIVNADGVGFAVAELSSGRESFSPDASFYDGPLPKNPMRFISGAPTFAVEVRSENDYGETAERDMAAKRNDYFEAGTQVVWDVDPIGECVNAYQSGDPEHPRVFRRGEVADAEPAVLGWRMDVDRIFSN